MIIKINEYDSFFMELTPETVAEAALLIRMGVNHKKEIEVSTWASASGSIGSQISIGRRIYSGNVIPSR